jgi:Ca2+-binding RTX toxin-like protein
MTVYIASTTADISRDLASIRAGDTIRLNPGTYSGIAIQNLATSGVTITSASATNLAKLTDLKVTNSSGLTFSNLEMTVAEDTPFQIRSSSNIVLDGLDVHGSLDGTSSDDFRGMVIRSSTNVTVSNSHFHELTDALSQLNDTNVTFTGNRFDTIRDDGIIGGGSSNITVSNNVFSDFDHVGAIHPDAIQFYTNTATLQASNITVSGNVINRGSGSAIQGIWINNDSGTQPYRDLTVTNNVVVGAVFNGIVVSGATDATVSGNVVVGESDQKSWLGMWNVASAHVSDNVASSFDNVDSNVSGGGDVITSSLPTSDAATFSSWLNSVATPGTLSANTAISVAATLLNDVGQIGYVDGASLTGQTHTFQVVQVYGTSGADFLAPNIYGSSHLYGYAGNDFLIGSKNGIASTLEGGPGDDRYTIYQSNDVVVENPGEGNDIVFTYVDYTMPANVETMRAMASGLTLTGNSAANKLMASSGGDTLIGGAGADTLLGGDGNDVLIAGTGSDVLRGGAGADKFVFDNAPGASNLDLITDFTHGQDVLQFSKAIFAGLQETGSSGNGTPLASASELLVSSTATTGQTSAEHFIYNTASGILYYDATGTGSSVAVVQLGTYAHPTVSYTDIHVIA